jgi:undecaprenyl pyrophosphate phosphatase UppP
MNTIISEETAILLIKIGFWAGAITDGLAIIPMLSRGIGVKLFGGDLSNDNRGYQYAMATGASLMAGWTLLLVWGTGNPLERRGLLLLTVFPVIAGIISSLAFAVKHRIIRRSRVIPLCIHLGVVSIFYVLVYVLSIPFAS